MAEFSFENGFTFEPQDTDEERKKRDPNELRGGYGEGPSPIDTGRSTQGEHIGPREEEDSGADDIPAEWKLENHLDELHPETYGEDQQEENNQWQAPVVTPVVTPEETTGGGTSGEGSKGTPAAETEEITVVGTPGGNGGKPGVNPQGTLAALTEEEETLPYAWQGWQPGQTAEDAAAVAGSLRAAAEARRQEQAIANSIAAANASRAEMDAAAEQSRAMRQGRDAAAAVNNSIAASNANRPEMEAAAAASAARRNDQLHTDALNEFLGRPEVADYMAPIYASAQEALDRYHAEQAAAAEQGTAGQGTAAPQETGPTGFPIYQWQPADQQSDADAWQAAQTEAIYQDLLRQNGYNYDPRTQGANHAYVYTTARQNPDPQVINNNGNGSNAGTGSGTNAGRPGVSNAGTLDTLMGGGNGNGNGAGTGTGLPNPQVIDMNDPNYKPPAGVNGIVYGTSAKGGITGAGTGSGNGSGNGNGSGSDIPKGSTYFTPSYGQDMERGVKAPYRKGGYTIDQLENMGNAPRTDFKYNNGKPAYEGYYLAPDGHYYPVDQAKANYWRQNGGSYKGWEEGMRDYYKTFGTFYGYNPTWKQTGRSVGGGGGGYGGGGGGGGYSYSGGSASRGNSGATANNGLYWNPNTSWSI